MECTNLYAVTYFVYWDYMLSNTSNFLAKEIYKKNKSNSPRTVLKYNHN